MGQESEKIKYNRLLVGDTKGKLNISLLVLFRPLNAFDPNVAEGPAKQVVPKQRCLELWL